MFRITFEANSRAELQDQILELLFPDAAGESEVKLEEVHPSGEPYIRTTPATVQDVYLSKKEEKPEPVIFTQPDPSPDDPSLEDLRRVMGQMINNGKMDAVQKIMKTLGVERLSDLEAEKYPALAEMLKEEGAQI
ncbi:MAG: hypothetical protein IJH92_03095 [Mogibacterium sp.]|nr:hypothetical protein [Mogibacterium sp.]